MQPVDSKVIRGYELRELIGKGGFAAVYRAYQPSVEREVAVKVILAKYANDPEFVRRFEAEAQLIARLEHIHIVPLYDYWREPNNAYLVMRWLRGGNLFTSIQKNGCWDASASAQLLEQIAAALAVAHRHGVIHRDLTPANILLDEEKNAYLADFGIAKEAVSAAREERLFGSPAYMAPEQIKVEPLTPQTDIYSLGIVLYEILTGKTPFDSNSVTELLQKHLTDPIPPLQLVRPDLPHSFNQVILRATAKNPTERYPDTLSMAAAFRQAIRGIEDLGAPPDTSASPSPSGQDTGVSTVPLDDIHTLILGAALEAVNPYKGLRPFEEADAMNFFGRDNLINQLLQRLAEETSGRFLAVVGPSGSGKSSVVKAGLIPALRHNALANSERWFVARIVPGPQPFQELETALLGVTFDSSSSLLDALQKDENGLFEVVRRILPADHTELVLVIDQFEEIFTLVQDEAKRALFLRSLLVAVTRPRSRLRVVLTLRADFYDRPLLYSGFGELIRQRTEVVLPLSPDELQEAIEGPATRAGLELESGLIAAIIADVTDQPGALPLLQYALTELYERREGRKLTLHAYRASGGVLGALARRAEDLYREMDAPQKDAARQLFLRLVRLGDGTEDTRRRVRWAELISLGSSKTLMQSVLELLGKYRLLTFDRDPQTREPTVEIAHEALIREWQQLREWLDDNRDDLRVQQRLASSTTDWLNTGRDDSYLASGARLTQFEALMTAGRLALNENEQAYVQASIVKRRRASQRVKIFVAALIVATLGALILAFYAFDQQNHAQRSQQKAIQERDRADDEARISRSRELAATALNNQDQIDLSLLLSLEALKVSDTLEARHSLFTALESSPYLVTFLRGHVAPARAVAFSPDGHTLASAAHDGTIILWDVASRQTILPPLQGHADAINSLMFSPSGDILASASNDGTVRLWNVITGEQQGDPIVGHEGAIWSVAISPDGTMIATGGEDGLILLHDLASGEPIGEPLTGHFGIVYSVTFSPDGQMLASGGDDYAIRLWNIENGEAIGDPLEKHTNWVWQVAFSPDGALLGSAGADNTVRLWDVVSRTEIMELSGHTRWVRSVAFSPDGQSLISGSEDGTVRLWDVASGTLLLDPLTGHASRVWNVAFSPDGHTLASAGEDTTVILWDIASPFPLQRQLAGYSEAVSNVIFSPHGTMVAAAGGLQSTGGQDNTVRLWNAETGESMAILEGHTDTVTSAIFSPDGKTLVSAGADHALIFWDIETRSEVASVHDTHTQPIMALAFSANGQTVATGGDDNLIILWDAETHMEIGRLTDPQNSGVLTLAFSPNGRLLVSGNRSARIQFWDVTTLQPLGESLSGHDNEITSLVFSPDGQTLASGSRDSTIRLWNVANRQSIRQLSGHTNWVLSVAFSPDGQTLASGSRDRTIILWDVSTSRAIGLPIRGQNGWITGIAFSPDGSLLASGSTDATVNLWNVSVQASQKRACMLANRSLSSEEWKRYFADMPYSETCPSLPTTG